MINQERAKEVPGKYLHSTWKVLGKYQEGIATEVEEVPGKYWTTNINYHDSIAKVAGK